MAALGAGRAGQPGDRHLPPVARAAPDEAARRGAELGPRALGDPQGSSRTAAAIASPTGSTSERRPAVTPWAVTEPHRVSRSRGSAVTRSGAGSRRPARRRRGWARTRTAGGGARQGGLELAEWLAHPDRAVIPEPARRSTNTPARGGRGRRLGLGHGRLDGGEDGLGLLDPRAEFVERQHTIGTLDGDDRAFGDGGIGRLGHEAAGPVFRCPLVSDGGTTRACRCRAGAPVT